MQKLQEQGRICYTRGEYKQAIDIFDRAIGRATSVQLLDNRAACYEKLNDLSSALNNAKKAIHLQREDATGYLRAGKILVKMEKQSVALEICTQGLKSIKHVGQGFELLRKVHKELMDQLYPPKSVDPLTVLPRELAELILEYLSFRQRMNACLVSTQWAQFIRSCPGLWQHLDLSGARRKVRSAFISRAINVGRKKLTRATLSYLFDFDKTLKALVKHCPLEELILHENGLQSRNLTEAITSAKTLKTLKFGQRTNLHAAEMRHLVCGLSGSLELLKCGLISGSLSGFPGVACQHLRTLSVTLKYVSDFMQLFKGISQHMTGLVYLSVHYHTGSGILEAGDVDLQNCTGLRELDLCLALPPQSQLKLPPSLVVFSLVTTFARTHLLAFHPPQRLLGPFYLPKLEDLTLSIPGMPIGQVIQAFADEKSLDPSDEGTQVVPSKLRALSVVDSELESGHLFDLFGHPRLDALKKLSLLQLRNCFDETVTEITEALPGLQSLDLSGTDITGVGVKQVVNSGRGHLEELILDDCRKLGSDAVDWARSQGICVRYRMNDTATGGRKIRF